MVSCDDREEDESPIDFDFSVFDNTEYEYPSAASSEDQPTPLESEMEVEIDQLAMEVESTTGGIATSEVFNMDPMLQAVHTPVRSRSLSPDSSDEESDSATLYNPSPSPPLRPTRARLAKQTSQATLYSRSPTPLIECVSSPAPSSFSAPSTVKVKVERGHPGPKKSKKRSGCGARKGEPRRCQNMIAQKKYRDKKVQASALMSDTLVDIKAALKYASPKKRLGIIQLMMDVYDASMKDLDPNLATKQDQAVKDQASQYDERIL